jgi:hypothetical protein
VRTAFPLINHAVEAADGHAGLEPEIATLAAAHLRHK